MVLNDLCIVLTDVLLVESRASVLVHQVEADGA